MKLQEIALIGNIRNDAYNAGYAAGYKKASEDIINTETKLRNEIHSLQERCAWLQAKHAKTVENYNNQVKNLQDKIDRLVEV